MMMMMISHYVISTWNEISPFPHFPYPCKEHFVHMNHFILTEKKVTNTHLRLTLSLEPVTTHSLRLLSAAQLCTTDAIRGLE